MPPTSAFKFDENAPRKLLTHGDFCDLYTFTYDGPVAMSHHTSKRPTWFEVLLEDELGDTDQVTAVLKWVRSSSDNDLIEDEAASLGKLNPAEKPEEGLMRYFPRFLGSVTIDKRKANAMAFLSGCYTLEQVHAAYPAGLDFRDLAWMLRRIFEGLGQAHKEGITHCALIPPHILIHPEDHGAKIIDWAYSVSKPNTSVKALSAPYKEFYPLEVTRKQFPSPATDIFMAAKCAIYLLGGEAAFNRIPETVPTPVQDFLQRCLHDSMSRRPSDAWELHDEFTSILTQLVGKPKFRPFTMPEATT